MTAPTNFSTSTAHDRWSYLWLLLGGVLAIFGSGRWTLAIAPWLAPVFLLRFTRTQRPWVGYLGVVGVAFVGACIGWYGLQPLPLPMFLLNMAIAAAASSLPFLFDRLLARRLVTADGRQRFASTLIFPLAVTAIEFLSLSASPLGSFGATAYSQYGNLPLLQLGALGGLWLITFVVNWLAAVVNWAWEQEFAWRNLRDGLLVYAGIMGAVFLFGAVRLWSAPALNNSDGASPGGVPVAAFTAASTDLARLMPLAETDPAAFRAETAAIHQAYWEQSRAAARAGAKIILWPEGAGIGLADDVEQLVAAGKRLADEEEIYLAMPIFALYPGTARPAENRLLIADPAGQIVLDHVKFGGNEFEGSLRGSGVLQAVETPYGLLAGVICWDTDFPAVIAQAGRLGADILLSPARDWRELSPLHGQMATFRAIENGLTIVRQADQGFSIVADPYGRTLASMDHFTAGERFMTVIAPAAGVSTWYSTYTDIVGWAAVVGFLALALWAIVAGRRTRDND